MKCDPKDLLLYAVTDRHWLNGRTLVDVVKESLDGGVTMIQLRELRSHPFFLIQIAFSLFSLDDAPPME